MATLKVSVNTSKARQKLARLEKEIDRGAVDVVDVIGQLGKQYARSIAPYYSGATFRNIILMKGTGKYESIVRARNPVANDGHTRRIHNFNLVRWMHTSAHAVHHIRSGDRRFMYTTRDYLKKAAPIQAQKRFDRIAVIVNR